MKNTLLAVLLLLSPATVFGQLNLEDIVQIDHTWVQGSYWSSGEYPGLGVLVDVQEDTMFGAVYGYMGNDPSFVVFVGTATSINPLVFEGNVFFVTEPGVSEQVVGTFRWETRVVDATPAARLSITSNILNDSNVQLVRFAYLEEDKVDTITGGDWTIATRILGITFGYHYAITDERFTEDDITFAAVVNIAQPDELGVVAYFPSDLGDFYSMLVEFDEDTNIFFVFFANNGNMYGRFWLLDEGETPGGDGNFFRGVADTLQVQNYGTGGDPTAAGSSANNSNMELQSSLRNEVKQLWYSAYRNTTQSVGFGFPHNEKMNAFNTLQNQLRDRKLTQQD